MHGKHVACFDVCVAYVNVCVDVRVKDSASKQRPVLVQELVQIKKQKKQSFFQKKLKKKHFWPSKKPQKKTLLEKILEKNMIFNKNYGNLQKILKNS